jgi:hypothetical protein
VNQTLPSGCGATPFGEFSGLPSRGGFVMTIASVPRLAIGCCAREPGHERPDQTRRPGQQPAARQRPATKGLVRHQLPPFAEFD